MRRFDLGERHEPTSESFWWTSALLHAVVIALGILVSWQAPYRPRPQPATEVQEWVVLAPVLDQRPARRAPAPPPGANQVRLVRPIPVVPPPLPTYEPVVAPERPPTKMEHYRGPLVQGPQLGDGRPWVSPRPALPAVVADALYGSKDTIPIEAVLQARLRAMLDTLNRAIDAEQRSGRKPTWATDIAGVPFSLDSQYINIAGIKVPTVALALLGSFVPQGELTDHLERDMHDDLMRAAARTQTYKDFTKYVKETRLRKQAERDAARARAIPPPPPPPLPPTPSDTTRVIP